MRSLPLLLFLAGAIGSCRGAAPTAASTYVDPATGIQFLSYADGTGYRFGFALPTAPGPDMIVQLISPLSGGAGWAGVDFGASMTGPLLLAAWPSGSDVMISPRVATGYTVADGANAYAGAVTLTPIAKGTFVNDTHVAATFVCAGCVNKDSFATADNSATFAFAYSQTAVATPADAGSALSDHTLNGEPYGSFGVTLASARSAQYATWAAMTNPTSPPSGGGGDSSSPTPPPPAGPSGSPGSPTPPPPAPTAPVQVLGSPNYGAGFYAGLTVVVVLYMLQPFL